jgi:hypothetical protein
MFRLHLVPAHRLLRASSRQPIPVIGTAMALVLPILAMPVSTRAHTADPAAPANLAVQTLGSGPVTGQPNRSLLLVRLILAPGALVPTYGYGGDVILTIESGVLGYTALVGDAEATWGGADEDAAGRAFAPGSEVLLYPGDWLRVPKGAMQRLRDAGPNPTVLLASAVVAVDEPFLQPFTSRSGHQPTP